MTSSTPICPAGHEPAVDAGVTSRQQAGFLYAKPSGLNRRLWISGAFAAWFILVAFESWTHLVWRDEVGALTIAVHGNTVFDMWRTLHGDAHPAVWYLLLRGAHHLVPRPEVLLIVSVGVAAAAMLLLLWRSPFSKPVLGLILLSEFSIYEYSVSARNYGISLLFIFLFALLYDRYCDKGVLLGLLLVLIVNCSTHAAAAGCGLLILWFVDVLTSPPVRRSHRMRVFLWNFILSVLGILACFLTVFPTYNDLSVNDLHAITLPKVVDAVFLPARQFRHVIHGPEALMEAVPGLEQPLWILGSLLLFGSTLGLIRRPGALLGGLITLTGLSVFFALIYPGVYRHEAVWIGLMIGLYWIAERSSDESALPRWLRPLAPGLTRIGGLCFAAVLVMQLPNGVARIAVNVLDPAAALDGKKNNIRSILAGSPGLERAVIVADPDYLVETVPYYVRNPTYLMREQRYGSIPHFTRRAILDLSLGDVLTCAQTIRHQTARPVVILLAHRVDPSLGDQSYSESFAWKFTVTTEEAREFEASTRFLTYRPRSLDTPESYYVYALDR